MAAQMKDLLLLSPVQPKVSPLHTILGRRIFDADDWRQYFGLEIRHIPAFPWKLEELLAPCPIYPSRRVAETHFAFLGISNFNGEPLTIQKWREIAGDRFYIGDEFSRRYNGGKAWYEYQPFANRPTSAARWYLVPILPHAIIFSQQVAGYTTVSTVEITTALLLFQQKHGYLPWSDQLMRTSDTCWFYTKTCVGSLDGKIWINTARNDDVSSQLGTAIQRLP